MRVTAGDGPIWGRAVKLLNDPILSEKRFEDPAERINNRTLMRERLEAWTIQRTTAENMRLFEEAGVPCGAVRTIAELRTNPHLLAREHVVEIEVPGLGKLPYFASPFRLSNSKAKYEPAPELGEHGEEILAGYLGMQDEEIAALKASGVLS